ncbi:MAG: hypothetical protein V1916_03050, partial [Patescibacteria group bacterium]
ITLTGSAADDGIRLAWTVNDLTIEKGFKVVKGAAKDPVYPGNDWQYLTNSAVRSYTWALTDGQTYHFRVCQYDGAGKCLSYSNDVAVQAKEAAEVPVSLTMSAKAEDTGVGLWWTDASTTDGFKYYKVVRSETNANLKYPDDGYIAVKSKGDLSHRDTSAVNGTAYYYRICAVGTVTACSNVAQVTAINENVPPAAVTASGSYAAGTLTLSWTVSAVLDFKYYKVAWSPTKSEPAYPADGYLSAVTNAATASFTDSGSKVGTRSAAVDLATGTHYYRVCVVDTADQVTCSNTVTLTAGVVQ